MTQQRDLALKGAHVEDWLDVRFFRPVGMLIARACVPTRITPNHLSLTALAIGLVAAHLLLYEGWKTNLLAFALIVVADLVDSSDGQLARLRGVACRTGRMLDGFVDNVRWIAVYGHLAARLLLHGEGLWVLVAAAVAGYLHGLHSNAVDIVTFGYLDLSTQKRSLDLPEDVGDPPPGWFWRRAWPFYRQFLDTQGRLFRRTVSAVRLSRQRSVPAATRARFALRARRAVRLLPTFGQNMHIVAVAVAGIAGMPLLFFLAVALPISLAAFVSTGWLEHAAEAFRAELEEQDSVDVDEPQPSP